MTLPPPASDEPRPRWQAVLPLLDEFASHLSPRCGALRLLQAVDRTWTDQQYKSLRPDGFPGSLRGVYLLFSAGGDLLYVGVTLDCYDKRVWSHGGPDDYRWIDIVPLEDAEAFLAPALECFLIDSLNPPLNSIHTRRP